MGYFGKNFVVLLGLLCLCMLCGHKSNAQTLPSSADPSRQNAKPLKEDGFLDVKPNNTEKQIAKAPALSPQIGNLKLVFKNLKVEGVTAFSDIELQNFYQEKIGKEIKFSELVDIMLSIQQLYYDSGYALSQVFIPEQNIQSGSIVFQVIEGYVAEVDIDPKLADVDLIDGFETYVLSMQPLNTKKLERIMLLLNDRPGLDVSSVLSSVENKSILGSGAVKLTLKQNDNSNRKTKSIQFDNYGSNFSGPGQVTADVVVDKNLPNYSDVSASFTQTTSARELRQGSLSYTLPVWGISGVNINLSGALTFTEPGEDLDDIDIKGNSKNISASVSYPVIRQRDQTLSISSGIDFKNTKTDILDDRLSDDRIRSLFFDARYTFSDSFKGINILNAKYSKGFDILGARESGSVDLSRQDGRSDYKKIEVSALRLQAISPSVDILATARGQYTSDPLLSSEEFGFGGSTLGRGYDSSEIAGDKGVSFSIEARRKGTLNLSFKSLNYEVYGFYDFGKVWNIDPSLRSKISAASFGLGTRLFLSNDFMMDLTFAIPLTKPVDSPPKYANENSPRVLFSLKYTF